MSSRAVHVFVEGRVQGVWFRGWTAREAGALGVSGWVRNLTDGRVEAVFSGNLESVEKMIRLVHSGPPLARVDAVHVEETALVQHNGFEKRPTQ